VRITVAQTRPDPRPERYARTVPRAARSAHQVLPCQDSRKQALGFSSSFATRRAPLTFSSTMLCRRYFSSEIKAVSALLRKRTSRHMLEEIR